MSLIIQSGLLTFNSNDVARNVDVSLGVAVNWGSHEANLVCYDYQRNYTLPSLNFTIFYIPDSESQELFR